MNKLNKKFRSNIFLLNINLSHLLPVWKLLFTDIIVIEGVGLLELKLMLLNSPRSFFTGSFLFNYFGGSSTYFGKGAMNPS